MIKKNISLMFLVLILVILTSCSTIEKQDLIVLHAGSLAIPFDEIEKEFEEKYPEYDIKRESAGSRTTVRKVTDLDKKADIVASADYTVINELMIPEYTEWYINFATNEMAIMYTENSKYQTEINATNWYEILLRKDVNYSHSDPNTDPCGYRSQLVWKLAEKFYNEQNLFENLDNGRPIKFIRPKETDLIAMLEAGELDYIFIYKSVAEQHNMPFVELPEQISLKATKYEDFYKEAKFDINGKEPGETITKIGSPMVYGITIPNNAPNNKGAILFLDFLLSEEGQKILTKNGQPPVYPIEVNNKEKIPEELKKYLN